MSHKVGDIVYLKTNIWRDCPLVISSTGIACNNVEVTYLHDGVIYKEIITPEILLDPEKIREELMIIKEGTK